MAGDDQQVVMVERSTRVPTPTFSAENFKTYMEEVEFLNVFVFREVNPFSVLQSHFLMLTLVNGSEVPEIAKAVE